jgi:hypothetical protein
MPDSIWTPSGEQTFRAGRGNAQLSRAPALASVDAHGPWRAHVQLVPLVGAESERFDICGYYYWRGNTLSSFSLQRLGHEVAQQLYRQLVDALARPEPAILEQLLGAQAGELT